MKLSEFDKSFFHVINDSEFSTLGNVTSTPLGSYLTFAINELFLSKVCRNPQISCVICPPRFQDNPNLISSGKGIAISDNPKFSFWRLHNELSKMHDSRYISSDFDSILGENCKINEQASVAKKNVRIGENVVIEANAIIKEGVTIGNNCWIKAGAIIGHDACLAGRDLGSNLYPLTSVGTVKLENNVQIGSYSCISKGLFPYEETRIGSFSLIGFSVDVSHNDVLGKNVIVLDQSQICGNVVVGDNVHIAPHSIVSNRLKLEDKSDISIGAVVVNCVKEGQKVSGNFAIEHSQFLLWHKEKLRKR